jgi:ABC-type oligopeptide transport system ATPase subunit
MIATGQMGVGKSFTTKKLLAAYEKSGRKIIIFDPNNEDVFHRYPALHFDIMEVERAKERERKEHTRVITQSIKNIINLPDGVVVRIAPFTIYGDEMNTTQKKLTMICLLENFRGGMLLLEDVNKYISNFQKEEVLGAFKAIRHKSQDIIMHMQSISPLRPIHFEACSVIRLHYDGFDVAKIKDRLSNKYALLKIAQLIVEEAYLKGLERFFCYVHLKKNQIKGVSYEQFYTACFKFLTSHRNEFRHLAFSLAHRNGRSSPSHSDNEKAMVQWIGEHLHFVPDVMPFPA